MKLSYRTLPMLMASVLLVLALAACETEPGVGEGADIGAVNEEIAALRGEFETLSNEWRTFRDEQWVGFQDEWGAFQEDWSVYREEIGLGE